MNRTAVVPVSDLRGLLHLAGRRDIRLYLNGINVEVTKEGHAVLVATCGTALGAVLVEEAAGPGEAFSVIVPRADVERATKNNTDEHIALSAGALGGVAFTPIASPFPDWRRVVPAACSGVVAQYDPELLMLFSRAAKAFGTYPDDRERVRKARKAGTVPVGPALRLSMNGERGAIVRITHAPRFVGVVNPWIHGIGRAAWVDRPAWIEDTTR